MSRRVRIVAPIPKQTETGRREQKKSKDLCITCHVLRVKCHLSLTPTVTAPDPPPANSPTMHSMLVRKDPKTQKNFKTQKSHKMAKKTHKKTGGMPILAIRSSTISLQSTGKRGFQEGTDIVWTLRPLQ